MSEARFEPADVAALRRAGDALHDLNKHLRDGSRDATDLETLAVLQRSADEAITAAQSAWKERGRVLGRHPGSPFLGSLSHVRLVSVRNDARSYASRYHDAFEPEAVTLRRELLAAGADLDRLILQAVNAQRNEHVAARNSRIAEAIDLDLDRRARGGKGDAA